MIWTYISLRLFCLECTGCFHMQICYLCPIWEIFSFFFLISFPSPSPLFSLSGSPIFCCASPRSLKLCPFSFFYLFSKLVCSQVYSSIICNVVLSQSSVVLKKKYFTLFFSTILSVVLEKNHCPIVSVAVSSQCCLPLIVFSL